MSFLYFGLRAALMTVLPECQHVSAWKIQTQIAYSSALIQLQLQTSEQRTACLEITKKSRRLMEHYEWQILIRDVLAGTEVVEKKTNVS